MLDPSEEKKLALAPIEGRYLQICKEFAENISAIARDAAEIKRRRDALEQDINNRSTVIAGELVTAGMNSTDVDEYLERLMEKAFAK